MKEADKLPENKLYSLNVSNLDPDDVIVIKDVS